MEERIVMFPAPGMGHVVSMVELAKKLHQRFQITILLTTGCNDHPSIHPYIHRISSSLPSISFHRLPLLPTPTSAASVSRAALCFQFIRNSAPNVASALTLISQTSTVKAFIIDLFCTSAMTAATSIGIPVYYFFTSGAAVLALFSYFPRIHDQTDRSFKDLRVELSAPGNTPLRAWEMPEPMLDREDPAYWDMLYFCTHMKKSSGIIVNTFKELEPNPVKTIEQGLCFPEPNQRLPVYYVGPLIADPNLGPHQQQAASGAATDGKQWLSWLEKQPSRSVVFLCFGSRGSFSVGQLKEIADGLEKSGVRFLWVVKRPPQHEGTNQIQEQKAAEEFELSSVLPSGFLERTRERGMVLKSWAPQVEVLSHESIGGFVSHCGWNSVLEAVVAGVPMIAWPLYAEQHVNRNLMVEEMKVAVGVEEQRKGDGSVIVSGDEVDKRLRELMDMDSERGKQIRERSLKMRDMASAAFAESGSSSTALANLLQSWTQ